ncbi:uncharacterized protein LOC135168303 [Diachasmimorpha longicaudata]|uniref:uncharacterized protein LOC135168303 n=1 Tax=Diachasmimorpha longicaudata TaxID=58733 RepID=UPI0030B8E954
MYLAKFNQKISSKIARNVFVKKFQTIASLLSPCSNDAKRCVKRQKIGRTTKSRCDRMREAIEKCPKILPKETCPSYDAEDNSSILKTENAADVYLRSQRILRLRASELMKFLQTRKSSLLIDMRKQLDATGLQDIEDMRKIICSIDKKMRVLVDLDVKCGLTNKFKVLKLTDQASQKIKVSNRSSEMALESLHKDLDNLVNDTCCKIDTIMKTMAHCKNCQSPESLGECVKSRGVQAVELLDQLDQDLKRQIETLERTHDDVLSKRRLMSKTIFKEYQKNTSNLSDELSDFIRRLELKSSDRK